MKQGGGGFVIGFLIGALAGAVVALLWAPASGDELRQQIAEKGVELKDQAKRAADEAEERGRIVLSENVKKAQQVVQQAQTKIGAVPESPAEVTPA
jgi:gas vesicle protein